MGDKLSIRGVYRSLKKIYQINQVVKEIRKSLREPEMIKNMDNMRLAAETMQNASKRLESSIQEIKKTGVFEEASEVLKAARENKNNMSEITSAVKEMQVSITALRDELRLTANDFKGPVYFRIMILSLGPTLLVMSKILPRNIIQTTCLATQLNCCSRV